MSRPGPTSKSPVRNNSGTRVLVVEDFADNRDLLIEYLTFRGFAVTAASDGEAALRSVREHAPDVVLIDLRMPGLTAGRRRGSARHSYHRRSRPFGGGHRARAAARSGVGTRRRLRRRG